MPYLLFNKLMLVTFRDPLLDYNFPPNRPLAKHHKHIVWPHQPAGKLKTVNTPALKHLAAKDHKANLENSCIDSGYRIDSRDSLLTLCSPMNADTGANCGEKFHLD